MKTDAISSKKFNLWNILLKPISFKAKVLCDNETFTNDEKIHDLQFLYLVLLF